MEDNAKLFYQTEKKKYSDKLEVVQKQLKLYGLIRFTAFVTTVFCVYYFLDQTGIMIPLALSGATFFVIFLKKYWRKKEEKNRFSALVAINQLELDVSKGDFSKLETGDGYKNPKHAYNYDIDLFGKGSFFQFLNRTVTNSGREELVAQLNANDISHIEKKQAALKELANLPKWRQEFSALAGSIKTEIETEEIIKWIQSYKKAIPSFGKWLPIFFSTITCFLLLGISFFDLSFHFLTLWFFVGLTISSRYLKKVNYVYVKAGKVKSTFQQYYKLLQVLEQKEFSSELLKSMHAKICGNENKASQLMQFFFDRLNALDQRNNIIVAVFGNGLLLWDMKQTYQIESWIEQYRNNVADWFQVISFFDAQNSLANYTFNNASFVFPSIVKEGPIIVADNFGHPLLSSAKRITSDCHLDAQEFFIITGANMAGKSTFLRTLSLGIVMTNIGLPVCAKRFIYKPIKLITSIRNSDSLAEDTSYFFSELKRLKYIVEALKEEDYFVVLDEILKGTNSTDKAQGSQKFVERLIASQATGVIATHDLSLCEIESEYDEIHNYYFDAEIKNDELYFDYRLKKGICQNMNASFLLRKMEIV